MPNNNTNNTNTTNTNNLKDVNGRGSVNLKDMNNGRTSINSIN